MIERINKTDVLNALANLSSDEVFTPPRIVNDILDSFPNKIWSDLNMTFLDPSCKSGVFLREITRRLMEGLKSRIPKKEERLEHILKYQVFGIATTGLTGLISRRSLYLSRDASSKYSIIKFDNKEGKIIHKNTKHTFINGSCIYCGAKKEIFDRGDGFEQYAYSFIHVDDPEEIFNMKFDVIIGNPPYHLKSDDRKGGLMKPIYQRFVEQAKKLQPTYLSMIIPSRWFAGGVGLKDFRKEMLRDKRLKKYVDFRNAKDCFPEISLGGGVGYFLWESDYDGKCTFVNKTNRNEVSLDRYLDQYEILVRDNIGIKIIDKIHLKSDKFLSSVISKKDPFNIPTKERGKDESFNNSLKCFHSKGSGYIENSERFSNNELVSSYKLMVSETTSEHAGEPSKDGTYKVTSTIKVLEPGEVCTMSYICFGPFQKKRHAEVLKKYLETKFARFLILQATTSIHLTKGFIFVPQIDFEDSVSDEKLYKHFNLSKKEIEYIDSLIKEI
jgi:site-specific DNA-methyltransferase (adenine-specific)